MTRIIEWLCDGRRLIHYGGGLLCLGLATLVFFSSPPPSSPLAQPGTLGQQPTGSRFSTGSGRGAVALYGLGMLLLVTGGRSDAEKRGYNF